MTLPLNTDLTGKVAVVTGAAGTPVSYTHLDVYKRQSLDCVIENNLFHDVILNGKDMAAVYGGRDARCQGLIIRNNHFYNPVSYTHLDVYKRQPLYAAIPAPAHDGSGGIHEESCEQPHDVRQRFAGHEYAAERIAEIRHVYQNRL